MHKLIVIAALLTFIHLQVIPSSANAQTAVQPRDQEECTDKAAKEAKTTTGVRVMVENCKKRFPAVRNPIGGYSFFDTELNEWVPVSGPKLSQADIEKIYALRLAKKFRESGDRKIIERNNAERVEIEKKVASDLILLQSKFGCKDSVCSIRTIEFQIQNMSNTNVDGVWISYEFGKDLKCENLTMNKKIFLPIDLRSYSTSSAIHELNSYPSLTFSGNTFCRKVAGVALAR